MSVISQLTIPVPITPPDDGKELPVKRFIREQTNWCWAACVQMVLHFFTKVITDQCAIADRAFTVSGCCNAPSSSVCNLPLEDDQTSLLWKNSGVKYVPIPKAVVFPVLQTEINECRPVEVAFDFDTIGHLAIVCGWLRSSTLPEPYVIVRDPYYEVGSVAYSSLKEAYGGGRWTATWIGLKV